MFEKRLAAVPPQAFTADGTDRGIITVADTRFFKVKQVVTLMSSTQPNLELQVQKVISTTQFVVGPVGSSISTVSDISAYTLVGLSFVFANEQKRPTVPFEESMRAVYDEEPTVALRSMLVDLYGRYIDTTVGMDGKVRLAVDATVTVGDVQVELDAQEGDNVAISAHPAQIFDEGDDVITTDAFEAIYSYTSANNATKIVYVEATVSTASEIRLVVNGDIKRVLRTSPTDRNAKFVFHEHLSLLSGQQLIIEARVDRLIHSQYETFASLQGYLA